MHPRVCANDVKSKEVGGLGKEDREHTIADGIRKIAMDRKIVVNKNNTHIVGQRWIGKNGQWTGRGTR